jgi:hypothetical protein
MLSCLSSVLRAEGRAQAQIGEGGQRIQGMRHIGRHRGRVGEQGNAPAGQRPAQFGFGEQAVESEFYDGHREGFQTEWRGPLSSSVKASRW